MHQLPAAAAKPVTLDVDACCALMQQHLEERNRKLHKLRPTLLRLEARYHRLKSRQQMLDLLHNCNGPDGSKAAEEWLSYAIFLNEHQLRRMQIWQLFMMEHKMNMLLAEITATEQILKDMKQGNPGDAR